MPEPWIQKIIQDIKIKDAIVAERAIQEACRRKVTLEHAPVFWRDFADFLHKFVNEIHDGLRGDATEGEFSFELNDRNYTIEFKKSAFPFVLFTATPEFATGKVTMNLTKVNPSLTGQASGSIIPCRFELRGDNAVMLHLNGHAYSEPEDAAKFIIERAFTV